MNIPKKADKEKKGDKTQNLNSMTSVFTFNAAGLNTPN